jgi:hypothetical protein
MSAAAGRASLKRTAADGGGGSSKEKKAKTVDTLIGLVHEEKSCALDVATTLSILTPNLLDRVKDVNFERILHELRDLFLQQQDGKQMQKRKRELVKCVDSVGTEGGDVLEVMLELLGNQLYVTSANSTEEVQKFLEESSTSILARGL